MLTVLFVPFSDVSWGLHIAKAITSGRVTISIVCIKITHSHEKAAGHAENSMHVTHQMTSMLDACTFRRWISDEPCDE
jgi:hypothetical protein